VLPTYPALAYLVADMLIRSSRGAFADLRQRGFRIAAWVWAIVVIAIGLGPWAGVILAKQYDGWLMIGATLMLAAAAMMGIGTAIAFQRGRILAAARAMGIGMIAIVAIASSLYLPRYDPLRMSSRTAEVLKLAGMRPGEHGYMIDYKEPSLAFHQGGGLREQRDDLYLNDHPPADWPQWVVLTQRVWDRLRDDVRAQWDVVGEVHGLAYNERGKGTILVLRRRP
jgi:hypothetical protein